MLSYIILTFFSVNTERVWIQYFAGLIWQLGFIFFCISCKCCSYVYILRLIFLRCRLQGYEIFAVLLLER